MGEPAGGRQDDEAALSRHQRRRDPDGHGVGRDDQGDRRRGRGRHRAGARRRHAPPLPGRHAARGRHVRAGDAARPHGVRLRFRGIGAVRGLAPPPDREPPPRALRRRRPRVRHGGRRRRAVLAGLGPAHRRAQQFPGEVRSWDEHQAEPSADGVGQAPSSRTPEGGGAPLGLLQPERRGRGTLSGESHQPERSAASPRGASAGGAGPSQANHTNPTGAWLRHTEPASGAPDPLRRITPTRPERGFATRSQHRGRRTLSGESHQPDRSVATPRGANIEGSGPSQANHTNPTGAWLRHAEQHRARDPLRVPNERRPGGRGGTSTCRSVGPCARRADSAGSSSVRRGTSRPSSPCAG